MLHSEVPFRQESRVARVAAFILGEGFLGFLGIQAVGLTLFQSWFSPGPTITALIGTAQWGIIALFALEYGVALFAAPSKRQFLINPWRLIDLATIIIPFLTLLPSTSHALRSSPVLRLIRLVRIATLGLRVSGSVIRERSRQIQSQEVSGPVEVCVIREGSGRQPVSSSWEEFLRWVQASQPEPKWFNVSNLDREALQTVATAAGMPVTFFESHLLNATYPHLEVVQGKFGALFIWLVENPQHSPVFRNGVLTLVSPDGLITLARHNTDLTTLISKLPAQPELAKAPFPVRMACTLLQLVVSQNEVLTARSEAELSVLEDLPLRESRPAFFEKTFRLKKDLSATQSDLWRLKGVLGDLADRRTQLPGSDGSETEFLRRLSRDAEYLYDTTVNTREELLSLIDLHLNIVSFDMNRVMRVLAVVSVLGLIPAVVGGLFGMNLIDNPWPWTLKQVSFCVGFAMTMCLYFFFVKGWLR